MIQINYSGLSADVRFFLPLGEPSNTAELQPHLNLGAQPCLCDAGCDIHLFTAERRSLAGSLSVNGAGCRRCGVRWSVV